MLGQATQGIKNAKPRLKTAKEEIPKLSREYLAARNRQMHAKALMAEMEGAARRGELISLKLARLQLGYLLVATRQRILAMPTAYGPRLVGMADAHAATEVLREAALALLEDLQNMPEKVTDPRWIESLAEENGEKPGPPSEQGKPLRKRPPQTAARGRRKPAATS
jgi:hypothetical protein